jgi:hypothetical protein
MRLSFALAPVFGVLAAVVLAATPAAAQTGAPTDTPGTTGTPSAPGGANTGSDAGTDVTGAVRPTLEIVLERIDGKVACRTDRPRLPADAPIDLRVTNHSGGPAVFSAIQFLVVSKNLTSDTSSDAFLGRIGLKDNDSVDLKLRTPARTGEYPYACVEPDGFLVPGPSGMQAEPVKTDGVFVVVAPEK